MSTTRLQDGADSGRPELARPADDVERRLLDELLAVQDAVAPTIRAAIDRRVRYLEHVSDNPARDVPAGVAAYGDKLLRNVEVYLGLTVARWRAEQDGGRRA